MNLYVADFNLVACDLVSFHLIVILKQNLDADVYAAFSTVCSCKLNCSHQGAADMRRHVDYAKSL